MLEVKRDDVIQLSENVVLHAIPDLDKFWVFCVDSGDHYELNESAYFLLSQFCDPCEVSVGLNAFRKNFNVDEKTAEADCLPLLGRYIKEGIFVKGGK